MFSEFDPTHPPWVMLGPARAAHTCRVAAPARRGNSLPPGRRRLVSQLSPLGCDSDTTACGPPWRGRSTPLGPIRSRVARHERTCDPDDSESARGGGCSESDHLLSQTCAANRLSSYHHPPCCRREGVLDRSRVRARRRRRDAMQQDPKRRECPHLILRFCNSFGEFADLPARGLSTLSTDYVTDSGISFYGRG